MDLSSLQTNVHTLKGSLVNLGFKAWGVRLEKVEKDAAQGRERAYAKEFAELEQELAELFL